MEGQSVAILDIYHQSYNYFVGSTQISILNGQLCMPYLSCIILVCIMYAYVCITEWVADGHILMEC